MSNTEDIIRLSMDVSGRGIGKTHKLCELAKEKGATVVTINAQEAERLKRDYGVKAISQHQLHKTVGLNSPMLFETEVLLEKIDSLSTYKESIDRLFQRCNRNLEDKIPVKEILDILEGRIDDPEISTGPAKPFSI